VFTANADKLHNQKYGCHTMIMFYINVLSLCLLQMLTNSLTRNMVVIKYIMSHVHTMCHMC